MNQMMMKMIGQIQNIESYDDNYYESDDEDDRQIQNIESHDNNYYSGYDDGIYDDYDHETEDSGNDYDDDYNVNNVHKEKIRNDNDSGFYSMNNRNY